MADRAGPRVLAWALLAGALASAEPGPAAAADSPAVPDSLTATDSASVRPALTDSAAPAPVPARAGESRAARRFPGAPLLLRIPVVDWPHGFEEANAASGFESPSMQQALLWNAAATQLGSQAIAWLWDRDGRPTLGSDLGTLLSLAAFAYVLEFLPLGDAWLHEEWHRAVLTRRGAGSHNGVYYLDFGASLIKVDEVEDADLVRLKREHPADFIRLMSAGIESGTEGQRLMRRHNFFLGRPSGPDRFAWWVSGFTVTYYLAACANGWIDRESEELEAGEASMAERDFTGPDLTAWVHDLRRPRDPYAAGPRGRVHPSGTGGYRRYLATGDLTEAERDYLNLQAGLSLLNFATPQFWGPDWLPGALPWSGERVLWNAGGAHHLAPFGYEVAADLLLRRGRSNWVYTLQAYVSADLALPGISAQLWRYPYALGRKTVYLTGGASAWLQPEGLLFDAGSAAPGGALLAGLALPFAGGLELWVEADAKTEGWVPGNVYLDPAVQARAGLAWSL